MSASDLATVIVAIAAVAAVAVAVAVLLSVREAARDLRRVLEQIERTALPAVASLEADAATVRDELERASGLLDRVDVVTARADGISRITYRAIAEPVIKTASVIRGTTHAGRRLRRTGRKAS